jgi:putative solute:sodium symporter small subunit
MAQSGTSMKRRSSQTSAEKQAHLDAYWRSNVRLITVLLLIWFGVSYVPVLIVSALNAAIPHFLTGFPFGYYMGSQGSLIVFVVLIFVYAWRMEKLDREYGFDE